MFAFSSSCAGSRGVTTSSVTWAARKIMQHGYDLIEIVLPRFRRHLLKLCNRRKWPSRPEPDENRAPSKAELLLCDAVKSSNRVFEVDLSAVGCVRAA